MSDTPKDQADSDELRTEIRKLLGFHLDCDSAVELSPEVSDWENFIRKRLADQQAADRQALLDKLPAKKPKVVKRKGYYPPFQPQVEQHERNGFNEAIDQVRNLINGKNRQP